jgi:DNA-binding winged helix-turn-helix (wHTH) protein/Tol biopolymer transport system component
VKRDASTGDAPRLIRFGVFELDRETGELRRSGAKIKLQTQPFQILVMLLERPGELVTREELRRTLWPADTFVDFEHGLNAAVKRLRDALGDTAETPVFIETLPRRGYRFLIQPSALSRPTPAPPVPASATRLTYLPIAIGVLLALSVFLISLKRTHTLKPIPQLKHVQLTDRTRENAIFGGAISPDGKYLAYVDAAGLYVKLLNTGETQSVTNARGSDVDAIWWVVSWFPDSTKFLANEILPEGSTRMWIISVIGQVPRKLRDNSTGWSVSPDGMRLVFSVDREVWMMNSNGEEAHAVYEPSDNSDLERVEFSPTGERLAYIRSLPTKAGFERSIDTIDLRGLQPTRVISLPNLHDYVWLADGHLLYSVQEPDSETCNLWEITLNTHTGIAVGSPHRLTDWAGFCVDNLSATSDSDGLAFQRWTSHHAIYVAGLSAQNTRIDLLRKLTLTTADHRPTAWTANSKAVIFASNREGHWGIYKQNWNEDSANLIVITKSYPFARMSPDGKWILYYSQRRSKLVPVNLMRIPVEGGSPELVFTAPISEYRCARTPSRICAFDELTSDGRRLVFKAFEVDKRNIWELAWFDTTNEIVRGWDLSPDGTRIAILGSHSIHLLLTNSSAVERVIPWFEGRGWTGFDWASDGKGFFISRMSSGLGLPFYRSRLYFVSLSGNAHLLWRPESYFRTYGVPSPDGRHIALDAEEIDSNIWMIKNVSATRPQ